MLDEKRTLELLLPRPPLQLLKPPSVGSAQGMLGAQASPTSTEPPLVPELSRSPPALRLEEARTPPVARMPLLLEKATPPLWERLDPETNSGPHSTPPRELLTAVERKGMLTLGLTNHQLSGPKTKTTWKADTQMEVDGCCCIPGCLSMPTDWLPLMCAHVYKLLFICVPHWVAYERPNIQTLEQ